MQQPNKFIILLKEIWPTIYRVINAIAFFLLMLVKNFIKFGMQQLKGKM
ncbi:MAG: hypothetical protein HY430_00640 [Candidatus Levybacteria bacterium]|nr:hypothetical protein [Candidatus Levybacteria bacterium]